MQHIVTDAAGVVFGAGPVKLSSVHLSIRPSIHPIIRPMHVSAAGLLLWARRQEIWLWSSFTQQLLVPPYRLSTVGRRSFSVAASTFWNTLPNDI